MSVIEVTDASFEGFVGAKYAVVDCWAPWCGPCRRLAPIIEKLAEISAGEISVGKLNVDENQKVSRNYNISSIPTILVFKDGKLEGQIVGLSPTLTAESIKDKVLEL
ncbi:MAG: thioredoxin [Candidatus Methanomethylophilaceae archaeon]|nr:thioredoxin [Candidatus Methanomethylophilaceae archaeon]